jgi:hypothetical protein
MEYNNETKRNVSLSIRLTPFSFNLPIISIFIYNESSMPSNSSECVGSAASTPRAYASITVIQMIAENNKLWRYGTLEWHNVFTKNREHQ